MYHKSLIQTETVDSPITKLKLQVAETWRKFECAPLLTGLTQTQTPTGQWSTIGLLLWSNIWNQPHDHGFFTGPDSLIDVNNCKGQRGTSDTYAKTWKAFEHHGTANQT